jgi:ankyrin repeat protein
MRRRGIRETALHLAAKHGHELTVRLLLGKGASSEVINGDEYTAPHVTAEQEHEAVIQLLLENGANLKK